MDTLICLIGESGSGKSTAAEMFKAELGYNIIRSFTTRPARTPDENTHTFVDAAPDIRDPDIIAYTYYNGYHYWATRDQYRGQGASVYVIDPAGVESLKSKKDLDARLLFIYLKTDIMTRANRMEARPDRWERIQNDQKDFAVVECDYTIDANHSPERVWQALLQIIWKELKVR